MFSRLSPNWKFAVVVCGAWSCVHLPAYAQLELNSPDPVVPPSIPLAVPPTPIDAEIEDSTLPDGAEVMVTGPLHEAFAEQFSDQAEAGIVVSKQPPEAIDEIPPEYRPDGEDIVWIPGYWGWDPEREDFLWVTGIWRQAPPDRNWVPGYWAQVPEGYQWIAGFWSLNATNEIRYLPTPPEPLVADPSTPAPSDDHFWIPGQWSYVNNNYQWRAGYWTMGYPDWVWVPDRYVWTPSGCIYRAGYWDYVVAERGTVFCPVYWSQPVVNYRFRPTYVVSTGPTLLANLFVYPRYHHYFFGNYYSSRNLNQTIYPWVTYGQQSRRYDPLYGYYRTQYRDVDYINRLLRLHNYYAANVSYQPPRTLAAQHAHQHDFHGAEDLAFHAMKLNKMASVPSNSHHSMQLVRLADSERHHIQQGLDPARELRKQRAQFEAQARSALVNNGNNNVNNNGRPANGRDDRQPGAPTKERWSLPKTQDGARLGSVSIGQPRSSTSTGEAPRKNDSNRGQANVNPADARNGSPTDRTNPSGSINPADSNRDGIVDARDQRRPDSRDPASRDTQNRNPIGRDNAPGRDGVNRDAMNRDALSRDGLNRDALNRDALNRDALNRDGLNRDGLNRDALNRDALNRNPNSRDSVPSRDPINREPINGSPNGRDPKRVEPNKGSDGRVIPVPGLPGTSPAIRPGAIPNLPGTSPAFPGNGDRTPQSRVIPSQPNTNNNGNNILGGNRINLGGTNPGAGSPASNLGNSRPSSRTVAPPANSSNANPSTPRRSAGASAPPPSNIQGDLQKMRESSQRQSQRRAESNGSPRRASQAPEGQKNEKRKDK